MPKLTAEQEAQARFCPICAKDNTERSIFPYPHKVEMWCKTCDDHYDANDAIRAYGYRKELLEAENKKAFTQGVAYSSALLMRTWDLPSVAMGILNEAGFELSDLEQAGTDEYDLEPIRKEFALQAEAKAR